MKCAACGHTELRKEIIDEFQAESYVGLPNVIIRQAAYRTLCAQCGKARGIGMPDPEGLEAAVALARAMSPHRLDGPAIRFMRRALSLKARDLAGCLMVREETLSRWENDHEPIGAQHDKLLRLFVGTMLWELAPGIVFDAASVMCLDVRNLEPGAPLLTFHTVRVAHRPKPAWDFEQAA